MGAYFFNNFQFVINNVRNYDQRKNIVYLKIKILNMQVNMFRKDVFNALS